MTRLIRLDNDCYRYLADDDNCYHYGEYTSGGGFAASQTNRQILNLKKRPTSPQAELYWKSQAIIYWGDLIANSINLQNCVGSATFVPMPCSKPVGHPEYDDRMLRVLQRTKQHNPQIDVRPLLTQTTARDSQHTGGRMTPPELLQSLAIDNNQLQPPPFPTVIIFDDVITMGASFNAAKTLISQIPGVNQVIGIFLAKTIWPQDDFENWINLISQQ
jgi:hypothetical protein